MVNKRNIGSTWVVIVDGSRGRVYSTNRRLVAPLTLEFERSAPDARRPTRELGTDRPGRQEGWGGAHHSVESRADWHEQAKADFIKSFAETAARKAASAKVERVLLVAPPQVLGQLRQAMPRHLHDKISQEIGKDFTKASEHDLPRLLHAAVC